MNHSFNVELAKEVGILAATIFNNFGFWVENNRANGRNFHDGKFWTFNTVKAFEEQFPYATNAQITKALKKLRDSGYVETGNYNEHGWDRTLWYTLSTKGEALFYDGKAFCPQADAILQNSQMEFANSQNTIYTDINTDDKPDKDPFKEIIAHLNEKTGKNYRLGKNTRKLISARLSEGYTVDDFRTVIDNKCISWSGTDMEQYLRPSTLFAPSHFDDYLNETPIPPRCNEPKYGRRQQDISNDQLSDFEESRQRWEEYNPEEVR